MATNERKRIEYHMDRQPDGKRRFYAEFSGDWKDDDPYHVIFSRTAESFDDVVVKHPDEPYILVTPTFSEGINQPDDVDAEHQCGGSGGGP